MADSPQKVPRTGVVAGGQQLLESGMTNMELCAASVEDMPAALGDCIIVLSAPEIPASDWNNRIRDTVTKLASKIPYAGGVVSPLVGYFWPQSKVNIFEALKKDIMKLVKKEILDYELNERASELDALKVTIQRYEAAKNNEKAFFLNSWITEADRLSVMFRQSQNNVHLILPIITLALLHITGLRERFDYGKQLYQEDNTIQWKRDMEEMYKTYLVDFLPDIYKKWKVWRAEQVEYTAWTKTLPMVIPPHFRVESYATVIDTITGEKKYFSVNFTESKTIFASICEDHKTRMCNEVFADMAGSIATTFEFEKLLPAESRKFPKYDASVFGRIFRGPYSQDLLLSEQHFGVGYPVKTFRSRPNEDDYQSNSGHITTAVIREWNTIDAMQFIYGNRQGSLAGNAAGGRRHDIDVRGKPLDGLRMGFSNGVLTYVQILYKDGTSSPRYGNRGGWTCYEASANAPTCYKVSSWSYRVDSGPSNTRGPSVIQLEYAPEI